jgi:Amt family ammonium transporter
VAAAVGAAIVGPRAGRWTNPEEFVPHNPALCVLGTLVLWFGWYGFNGASTLSMKSSDDAFSSALVCMNTTLAPAVAGLVVFLLRCYIFEPKCFDVMAMCNGILGGLVSITAPCGSVEPGEAVAIGFIGAFVYQGASMLMVKLKIDDPLDAFAVHGACGFWGVLAAGLFGEGNGAFYGGDQLGVQIVAALLITLWIMVPSTLLLFVLKKVEMLRVPQDVEKDGLDMHEHTPTGPHSTSGSPSKV